VLSKDFAVGLRPELTQERRRLLDVREHQRHRPSRLHLPRARQMPTSSSYAGGRARRSTSAQPGEGRRLNRD
jgi:hypothetical protein